VTSEKECDIRNYRVSFDKINKTLDFQCRMTVGEGVREIKEAIETGQIGDYRDQRYNNKDALLHLLSTQEIGHSSM
ncbi:MAG: hypothetical protein ACE5JL_18165, partial [Dehalococcoidia bacterium]